jgi:flap endonuclease-1
MGIKNLFDVIKNNCPEIIEKIHFSDLQGQRIAIDASNILYKSKCGSLEKYLDTILGLILSLKENGISMFFVFDGQAPPEKAQERKERMERREKIITKLENAESRKEELINTNREELTAQEEFQLDNDIESIEDEIVKYTKQTQTIEASDIENMKKLLDGLGIGYVTAPNEAEALAASMCFHGGCYGVLTEDSDVLTYGCPYGLFKVDNANKTFERVNYEELIKELDVSKESFVDACILLGCDYNKRIRGNGPKKVMELIWRNERIERMDFDDEKLSITKYERCRELFIPTKNNLEIPYSKPLNLPLLSEVLLLNNCYTRVEHVKKIWEKNKAEINFE